MKMRRCENEKMFYRPPLLEGPCAQTLSGKNIELYCTCLDFDDDWIYFCVIVFENAQCYFVGFERLEILPPFLRATGAKPPPSKTSNLCGHGILLQQ